MNPKITTIIPTFRRPQLLKRALASVLKQNLPNFEVLVLDNASGDETSKVIEEFIFQDSRVRYFAHEKNIGALANVECGIAQVRTPYFSVLGDDDLMLPGFYQSALDALEGQPEAAFFAGRCLVMTDREVPIALMPSVTSQAGYYRAPAGVLNMLSGRLINHLALTGILFRTEQARQITPWKTTEGYPFDIEFLLELAVRHNYILSDEVVLIAVMMLGQRSRDWNTLYKGWIGVFRAFIQSSAVPKNLRSDIEQKFRGQLKRAFSKIWIRTIDLADWQQAYILTDILGDDLGLERLASVLFRATQHFRKQFDTERLGRLRRSLVRNERKYADPLSTQVHEIIKFYRENLR